MEALEGAPWEEQLASVGFVLVFLLANRCASPVEELERLFALMRGIVADILDDSSAEAVH